MRSIILKFLELEGDMRFDKFPEPQLIILVPTFSYKQHFREYTQLFQQIQIIVNHVSLLSEGNVAEGEVVAVLHVGVAINGLAAPA
ncbi:MAG: hypothetical protein J6X71_10000 [Bacteroidales bacterium]|nr:hypothetical protein [Bacteroidales bacterium]